MTIYLQPVMANEDVAWLSPHIDSSLFSELSKDLPQTKNRVKFGKCLNYSTIILTAPILRFLFLGLEKLSNDNDEWYKSIGCRWLLLLLLRQEDDEEEEANSFQRHTTVIKHPEWYYATVRAF